LLAVPHVSPGEHRHDVLLAAPLADNFGATAGECGEVCDGLREHKAKRTHGVLVAGEREVAESGKATRDGLASLKVRHGLPGATTGERVEGLAGGAVNSLGRGSWRNLCGHLRRRQGRAEVMRCVAVGVD
jgi:hypothetical protein